MKNRNFKLIVLLIGFSLMIQTSIFSQLSVSSSTSATDLAQNLLGTGVTISNANLISAPDASGLFLNGSSTNLGVDEGVLLTSGTVQNSVGPNSSSSTTMNNNLPGDSDLNGLVSVSTYDATVLEFDFIPEGTSVSFNYTFASEEYEEYFCSNYNDVFAFLVSGPNPVGSAYSNYNIAIIPNTNDPVSINNVGPGECNGIDNSDKYINNAGGSTIEYDGFTNVFVAEVNIVPCQEYHIKLAIADSGDRILDSGVFIEAGSFVSSNVQIESVVSSPTCPNGNDGSIDLTVISGVSPFTFEWEDGSILEDRSGLIAGNYSVTITDDIDCSIESFNFMVEDGIDVIPPDLTCESTTLYYDSNGNATLDVNDIATADDLCGVESLVASPTSFSCILGAYDINVIATDVNGNSSTCTVTIYLDGDDSDCDTFTDACDLCDGGDDRVDNDGDGQPDCAYPPSFQNIIDDWKCGKNKVYMCHIPPGNPANAHTICINKNAIPAHIAHGDYLGPCGSASCSSITSDDVSLRQSENKSIDIYPNPASNYVTIDVHGFENNVTIEVRNNLGIIVDRPKLIENHSSTLNVSEYTNGIYFILIKTKEDVLIKKFIIR